MLKNKEYVSMSDVINHDQNLKKLEDDIESALKKQGVSIDGKTHLNIQRMTILVGNYCLDNTQDIYIPKKHLVISNKLNLMKINLMPKLYLKQAVLFAKKMVLIHFLLLFSMLLIETKNLH